MKKGEIFEGRVIRLDFPNKGVINIDGTEVAVKNVLPGQIVRFVISKKRNGRVEGRLLEVIRRSEMEAGSDCPHYPECGGCLFRTLKYEDQLKIKEAQMSRLFNTEIQVLPSPVIYGYRNKMEFSFGDEYKGGPLSLGLHKRGGFYDIVNVEGCRIVDEDYRKILAASSEFFRNTGLSFYKKMQHTGYLRHLVVRKAHSTGEILVNIVTTSQADYDMTKFADMLQTLEFDGGLTGVLHTINDSLSDVVQSDGTKVLFGRDYFYEELLGLKFRISPFSFFQTNSKGAEILYQTARDFILGDRGRFSVSSSKIKDETENRPLSPENRPLSPGSHRVVYDLYSGTGTIAQMISPAADKVIAVEIVEEAVEAAKENAALNGISNCTFIAGDVLKVIDNIEERPDFLILDPPRDGIHPKALTKLLERYEGEKILYISCKPTSLVRDMAVIKEYGYAPEKMCGVDMFPGTPNTEVVCLLSKKA